MNFRNCFLESFENKSIENAMTLQYQIQKISYSKSEMEFSVLIN